jgi:small subunit ribosomal protein S8e
MGISRDKWHKRRLTGGKRAPIRMKRKFELGRQPANTKLGERRVHLVRGHGGFIKFRALKVDHGNFSWPGEAVTRKSRIVGVVYNPTNAEFVRTNTIVKGSIVQIDATPFKNWYQKHYGVVVGKEVAFSKKSKKTAKKSATTKKSKPTTAAATTTTPVVKKTAEKKKATTATSKPATEKKPTHVTKKEVKPAKAKPTDAKSEAKKAKKAKRGDKHRPSGAMKKKWKVRNVSRVLESGISDQFEKGRLYAKISTSPGQCGNADGYVIEGEELAFYVKKMGLKNRK